MGTHEFTLRTVSGLYFSFLGFAIPALTGSLFVNNGTRFYQKEHQGLTRTQDNGLEPVPTDVLINSSAWKCAGTGMQSAHRVELLLQRKQRKRDNVDTKNKSSSHLKEKQVWKSRNC
ncbi:hypothetical protein [Pontibacter sp. HJ8]